MGHMKTIRIDYPGERTFQLVVESDASDEELAENAFAWFNAGSRREHPVFLASRARSMCVGDFVTINGKTVFQCEPVGWGKRSLEDRILFNREVKRRLPSNGQGAWFVMNDLMREKAC